MAAKYAAEWDFTCRDNGGKYQYFSVKANDKTEAIKKAFENQIAGKGFSLVEVVSACPTNWGMTPQKALEWVESDMLPYYPIGVYKDRSAAKEEK